MSSPPKAYNMHHCACIRQAKFITKRPHRTQSTGCKTQDSTPSRRCKTATTQLSQPSQENRTASTTTQAKYTANTTTQRRQHYAVFWANYTVLQANYAVLSTMLTKLHRASKPTATNLTTGIQPAHALLESDLDLVQSGVGGWLDDASRMMHVCNKPGLEPGDCRCRSRCARVHSV